MKYLLRSVNCVKRNRAIFHLSSVLKNSKQGLSTKSQETELVRQLKSRIKMTGPITVAEYMREVLSHPLVGYYMNKDVFGLQGDFITSPEISQMFGELIGIWFYDRWIHYGSPRNLQLVELGPGRGTLISDILRVFAKLGRITDSLSIHLVEISPAMRELQQTLLCGEEYHSTYDQEKQKKTVEYSQCTTKAGVPVTWYNSIFDVPKGLSFYLAHEFFDALPIHQFQKTEHGWREVMVDIDEENGPHHLKFCLAAVPTPATVLVPLEADGQVEVRPQGQVIAEKMAQNISDCGGCSLIVDYGDINSDRHTLRAFKNHNLTNPLAEPGHVDLTSNVDFSQLRNVFEAENVETFGPVAQRNFLMSMGIDVRKEILLKRASPVQARNIETAFEMLTDSSKMGDCFKFFTAVYSGTSWTTKPPGF